jgi:hypothetical protein
MRSPLWNRYAAMSLLAKKYLRPEVQVLRSSPSTPTHECNRPQVAGRFRVQGIGGDVWRVHCPRFVRHPEE